MSTHTIILEPAPTWTVAHLGLDRWLTGQLDAATDTHGTAWLHTAVIGPVMDAVHAAQRAAAQHWADTHDTRIVWCEPWETDTLLRSTLAGQPVSGPAWDDLPPDLRCALNDAAWRVDVETIVLEALGHPRRRVLVWRSVYDRRYRVQWDPESTVIDYSYWPSWPTLAAARAAAAGRVRYDVVAPFVGEH